MITNSLMQSQGVSQKIIEFRRAQQLKVVGLQEERNELKSACQQVSSQSTELVLGFLCDTGADALTGLRLWVEGLGLARGSLRAYDDLNEEVDHQRFEQHPVYVKYNSSDYGNAYMKAYSGNFTGGVFQPKLKDGEFRQYGNLPLGVF
jgi:hypothetical protein